MRWWRRNPYKLDVNLENSPDFIESLIQIVQHHDPNYIISLIAELLHRGHHLLKKQKMNTKHAKILAKHFTVNPVNPQHLYRLAMIMRTNNLSFEILLLTLARIYELAGEQTLATTIRPIAKLPERYTFRGYHNAADKYSIPPDKEYTATYGFHVGSMALVFDHASQWRDLEKVKIHEVDISFKKSMGDTEFPIWDHQANLFAYQLHDPEEYVRWLEEDPFIFLMTVEQFKTSGYDGFIYDNEFEGGAGISPICAVTFTAANVKPTGNVWVYDPVSRTWITE